MARGRFLDHAGGYPQAAANAARIGDFERTAEVTEADEGGEFPQMDLGVVEHAPVKPLQIGPVTVRDHPDDTRAQGLVTGIAFQHFEREFTAQAAVFGFESERLRVAGLAASAGEQKNFLVAQLGRYDAVAGRIAA